VRSDRAQDLMGGKSKAWHLAGPRYCARVTQNLELTGQDVQTLLSTLSILNGDDTILPLQTLFQSRLRSSSFQPIPLFLNVSDVNPPFYCNTYLSFQPSPILACILRETSTV